MVPLSAFSRVEESRAPLAINHQGQFPVVNISFNLAPGVSLGQAVTAIERARARSGFPRASRPPSRARRGRSARRSSTRRS